MSIPPSSPAATSITLPTPSTPRYHPEFTGTSGLSSDVTLVARDGVHFRINATALRLASGVFETTLSLPQPVGTEGTEPVIDSLDEDSEVLEDLLRIISGKELNRNRFISLDTLQPRLLAAEKWDMRGPLSIMRLLLCTNPDISSSDPMRVYWLGSHFGWRDVISAASKHACNDDLFRADKQSLLGQMDAQDLLRLMIFHKDRKDRMNNILFHDAAMVHENASNWCIATNFNVEYRYFACRILEEMDHTSPACKISGDKLQLFSEEAKMDASRCCSCNVTLCFRQDIIKQVQGHWDGLPEALTA